MGQRLTRVAAIIVLAASSLLYTSPALARPTSIRHLAAQELRLAAIAHQIAESNSRVCSQREALTGLVLHDLTRYDRKVRPAVSRAFSLEYGFGVLGVVPGSTAAAAGLQIDDEILAVGPNSVVDRDALERPTSYKRMEQFHAVMDAAAKGGQTELLVRRRGSFLRIPIDAKLGCGGKLALKSSSTLNAWSDGKHVIITIAMVHLSRSTDEIAFVIAHEMAHNILGHSRRDGGTQGIFGLARKQRGEIEADAYAVRLMANSGYRPAAGISFLETARRRLWWNVSLDHPGFNQRIHIVTAAIKSVHQASASRLAADEKQTLPQSLMSPSQSRSLASSTPTLTSMQNRYALAGYTGPSRLIGRTGGSCLH